MQKADDRTDNKSGDSKTVRAGPRLRNHTGLDSHLPTAADA